MEKKPKPFDGVIDFLLGEFGRAIEDARSKLVDESWFGRRTADRDQGSVDDRSTFNKGDEEWHENILDTLPAEFFITDEEFEKKWAPRERGAEERAADPPSRGIDLDR